MIKSRRIRQVEHATGMGVVRNAHKILVRNPEGKRPFERPARRWESNIKMDLKELG
jgi:hypothetical protein